MLSIKLYAKETNTLTTLLY